MNPLAVIEVHIAEFQALGARRIGVFGSFGGGEARDDSDVDVYVEFDDAKRCYDNFFALHERLEKLLGRRVESRHGQVYLRKQGASDPSDRPLCHPRRLRLESTV